MLESEVEVGGNVTPDVPPLSFTPSKAPTSLEFVTTGIVTTRVVVSGRFKVIVPVDEIDTVAAEADRFSKS